MMDTSNMPVTSREYKLMLNTDRFKSPEQGSEIFLDLINFLVEKEGGKITKKQNKEEKRKTSYLDTSELALWRQGFTLRLREEDKAEDGFQINLKYRSPDRYISAAQDLSSSQAGKTKFEEDILPPFVSRFSHSTSINTSALPDLSSMKKVISLFLGLKHLEIDGNTTVETVKGFEAKEVVRKLCQFQFEEATTIVKASLSFWHLTEKENDWPIVVEFSFDYDALDSGTGRDELEMYPRKLVEGANRFFSALQNQAGWVSSNTTTKTAFALGIL